MHEHFKPIHQNSILAKVTNTGDKKVEIDRKGHVLQLKYLNLCLLTLLECTGNEPTTINGMGVGILHEL